jgi:20S proteasome alpha/beta subunit
MEQAITIGGGSSGICSYCDERISDDLVYHEDCEQVASLEFAIATLQEALKKKQSKPGIDVTDYVERALNDASDWFSFTRPEREAATAL